MNTKIRRNRISYSMLLCVVVIISASLSCNSFDQWDGIFRKDSVNAKITGPADGSSFEVGDVILLKADISNIQGKLDISWSSSIDGSLSDKNWLHQIEVSNLSIGTHKINLHVSDDNSSARDSIKITIVTDEEQEAVTGNESIYMCEAVDYITIDQDNWYEKTNDNGAWICHQDIVLTNTHSIESVIIAWIQHATWSEGEDAIDQRIGRTWTLFPGESKNIAVGNMIHPENWNWEIVENLTAWYSTDTCTQMMGDYLPTESVPDKYLKSGLPVKSPGFDNICIGKDPP